MFDINDKSLKVVRIELTKSITIHFYYMKYINESSTKFLKGRSLILYYFSNQDIINEKVIKEYFSLIGTIKKVGIGSFINKEGSRKKRGIVNYALIQYEKDLVEDDVDVAKFQLKINKYLENIKMRRLKNEFIFNKEDYNQNRNGKDNDYNTDDNLPDEDGFYEIVPSGSRNKFKSNENNKELSFKVIKEEDEFMKEVKIKRKKKRSVGGRYGKVISNGKIDVYDDLDEFIVNDKNNDNDDGNDDDGEFEDADDFNKTDENEESNYGFYNIQQREKQKKSK